ncbi:MAG: hypothetical protein ABIQ16_23125, partial [Polyangiaceae bacterium]
MASETRKLKRAQDRQTGGEGKDPELGAEAPAKVDNPLGANQLKGMATRLLIPVVGAWALGVMVAVFSQSTTVRVIAIT